MPKKKFKDQTGSAMANLMEQDTKLKNLPKIGDIVKGTVLSASRKEVLLDIGGVMTGIIRTKELYNDDEDLANLQPGAEAEATVLELEDEQGMMGLSFRFAGHQKTWAVLQEFKEKGMTVQAKIIDANKGGLLITLNTTPGFLPVSQLSPEYYPRVQGGDKNKILERLKSYVGQKFNVKVLDIDPANEKLIVSEKAAWEETQKDVLGKYKVGDVVDGAITAVTDFGVFVEFGTKLEGLIHISELAWQRIDNPADLFKVSDKIQAEIIKIDGSKIFLSSKKLKKDPWADINDKFKVNDIVDGTVLKLTPFGLFVQLDENIHGLAHISELSNKKIDSMDSIATPGKVMKFRIVSIEPTEHRLGLSIKSLDEKIPEPVEVIAPAVVEESKEETK
ncbi:MAG: S1 RNA-binding domain-containing protein [Patescibacteria group bacterium]